MSGYSTDLRERIIRALQNGETQGWIAKTFGVSVSSVKRYKVRYEATGSVAATIQRRMEPRITKAHEAALRALVAEKSTLQLDQYCDEWEQRTGIRVSPKTMSRKLVQLSLRQKKDGGRG